MFKTSLTKESVYQEYIINNKTLYEVKRFFKCKEKTLLKYLKIYNFEEKYRCGDCDGNENLRIRINSNGFIFSEYCSLCYSKRDSAGIKKASNERRSQLGITVELLIDLHYTQFKPLSTIAKQFKVRLDYIQKLFIDFNIDEIKQCKYCRERDITKLFIRNNKIENVCKKCKSSYSAHGMTNCFSSKISQELFWSIYEKLPEKIKNYVYFSDLNTRDLNSNLNESSSR